MTTLRTIDITPLTPAEIPLICNYWLDTSQSSLRSMGVDPEKVPTVEQLTSMLLKQLILPIEKRNSYAIIWMFDGEPVGHSNTNPTYFGDHAYMHLHLWEKKKRGKGLGTEFVKLSVAHFFEVLQLKILYCQPYAHNTAPNKTLESIGFELVKEYVTIPGAINFEQRVKLWKLEK